MAVGLMLARPILAARVSQVPASAPAGGTPAAGTSVLKAERVLEAQAAKLETLAIPLGLAAIALGLLHLVLGWLLPLI